MDIHNIYELADRYKAGELSSAEQHAVDARLKKEPAFAKIFSEYLAAQEAIKQAARAKRKENLLTQFDPPKGKIRRLAPLKNLMAAAAVIFGFCLIGYWIWSMPPALDRYAQATEQVYQERILKTTTMSDEQFIKLFQEEKYESALALLKEEEKRYEAGGSSLNPAEFPKNLERQGFCYWKLNQWENALIPFQKLVQNKVLKPEFNPANYYLALTYKELGQQERSRKLLQTLAAYTKHSYSEKAKKLLVE